MPPDEDFAAHLDALAAQAVADRDYQLADYLFDAADSWAAPSEGVLSARLMLLTAAIAGEAARARPS